MAKLYFYALRTTHYARPARVHHLSWLLGLSLIFLASRLYNLTILPIFLDESLHILWALDMLKSGSWLAGDGARLLPLWILRLLLPSASDILWSGRLASVFISLAAALSCYLVGRGLFNRRVGLVTFGLYTLSPFTLNNDRLLIMTDVMLVMWAALAVWISLKLAKTAPSWRQSLGLGLVLGLVPLTNLRGILIWGLPFLAIGLLGQSQWRKLPKYLLVSYGLALLISAPVGWILRTGLQASRGVSLAGNPASTWLAYWAQNGALLGSWLWAYLTPGLAIALAAAMVLILRQQPKVGLLLIGWGLTFMLPWVLLAESWYPRYILPACPALFLLLGYLLDSLWQGWGQWPVQRGPLGLGLAGLALLLSGPALYFDYWQLHNPAVAPYPAADRFQYIEGWSSGYGVREVVATLRGRAAAQGEIFVALDHNVSKLMGQFAFESWREPEPALHLLDVKDQELSSQAIYQQVALSPRPVYWVAGDEHGADPLDQAALSLVRVEPVASFARPGNKSHLYVYYLSAK